MFRRFCGNAGWGAFSGAESTAIEQLASAHLQLLMEGSRLDVRSEAGALACAVFLARLEAANVALRVEAAPRDYRAEFSVNYRALFPDGSRHYRVDVLEVSVEQHAAIWVNGDKFELSPEAIVHAEELQDAMGGLGPVFQHWTSEARDVNQRPSRIAVTAALVALDHAWANFEHKYISNLIRIEDQARNLIVQAVDAETRLQATEHRPDSPECREAQRTLVACVARMNSVANSRRKGRDDLGEDILECATAVLKHCRERAAEEGSGGSAARNAAKVLATDVVGAWEAMRGYLKEVSRCLERVDPHLCNNTGLVARLVDWEESWELGARYVRQTPVLDAVCSLVAEIRAAAVLMPSLISMANDCDVELFFVLPRIIMLCFVADTAQQHIELIKTLLPHRFQVDAKSGNAVGSDKELDEFSASLQRTMKTLDAALPPLTTSCGRTAAWAVLVRRAVHGAPEQGLSSEVHQVVEDFMRELEGWSLELQRHCPEDWNQCSAVFVQCLNGVSKRQKNVQFQV